MKEKRIQKQIKKRGEDLRDLCRDLITKGRIIPNLCSAIKIIADSDLRKRFLESLLNQPDITFETLDSIRAEMEELLKETDNNELGERFWRRYFRLASFDELPYLIQYDSLPNSKRALDELWRRIKGKKVGRDANLKKLTEILKKRTDESLRIKVWDLLKTMELSKQQLLDIAKLECMNSLPEIAHEVNELIRQAEKRWFSGKKEKIPPIVSKINKLVEEIESLKKGQQ